MHKDWKQMFAAALTGAVARDDADHTAVANAIMIADLACAEITKRETADAREVGLWRLGLPFGRAADLETKE